MQRGKQEAPTFLENKKILNINLKLYIRTYISKSIIEVLLIYTAWKVSIFGVILVLIFPHLDRMSTDTKYLSVFSPNAGKYDQNNTEYIHFLHSDTSVLVYWYVNNTLIMDFGMEVRIYSFRKILKILFSKNVSGSYYSLYNKSICPNLYFQWR